MKFRIRIDELHDGDWPLIIKQTFFSLPFYYYIAFSADEPFLWWKGFFFEILEDGQISFLNLFIPLIFPLFISYWIIYSDLNKTEYDKELKEVVSDSFNEAMFNTKFDNLPLLLKAWKAFEEKEKLKKGGIN